MGTYRKKYYLHTPFGASMFAPLLFCVIFLSFFMALMLLTHHVPGLISSWVENRINAALEF